MVALGPKAIVTFSLLSGTSRQTRVVGTLFAMDMALVPVMVQDQHSHVDMEDPHTVEACALLQSLFEATSRTVWAKLVLLAFVLHWAPIACHVFLGHLARIWVERRHCHLRQMPVWLGAIDVRDVHRDRARLDSLLLALLNSSITDGDLIRAANRLY